MSFNCVHTLVLEHLPFLKPTGTAAKDQAEPSLKINGGSGPFRVHTRWYTGASLFFFCCCCCCLKHTAHVALVDGFLSLRALTQSTAHPFTHPSQETDEKSSLLPAYTHTHTLTRATQTLRSFGVAQNPSISIPRLPLAARASSPTLLPDPAETRSTEHPPALCVCRAVAGCCEQPEGGEFSSGENPPAILDRRRKSYWTMLKKKDEDGLRGRLS